MNEAGPLNCQIVQSVADVNAIASGHSPAHNFGVLETVMAETMGMAMHNAVSRQQGAGMIGSASVAAVCARLIGAPYPGPQPLPPLPPPAVNPLPPVPPWPHTLAETLADACQEGADAVELLQTEAAQGEDAMLKALAVAGLGQIRTAAAPVPPAASRTAAVPARPPAVRRTAQAAAGSSPAEPAVASSAAKSRPKPPTKTRRRPRP